MENTPTALLSYEGRIIVAVPVTTAGFQLNLALLNT